MRWYAETHVPLERHPLGATYLTLPDPPYSSSDSTSQFAHQRKHQLNVLADAYHPLSLPRSIILWRLLGESRNFLELRFMPIAIDQNIPQTQYPSNRPHIFKIPHTVIPGVSIFEDADTGSLCVSFVTTANLFYRLTFPAPLWFETSNIFASGSNAAGASTIEQVYFCRPLPHPLTQFNNMSNNAHIVPTLSHFVDTDTIVVAYSNGLIGTMVCPRSMILAQDVKTAWLKESNVVERYIPALANWVPSITYQIAGICSLLFGTHFILVFVLSQDQKVRVWNLANNALVASITLPASNPTLPHATASIMSRPHPFEDNLSNNLVGRYIQVFDETPEGSTVGLEREKLAFKLAVMIPSSVDPFLVILQGVGDYSGSVKTLNIIQTKACAPISGDSIESNFDEVFVDFKIINENSNYSGSGSINNGKAWMCWTLWELRGASILRFSPLNLKEPKNPMGERWTNVPTAPTAQKLPPLKFTTSISSTAWLDFIFCPGRYSSWVIEQALVSYQTQTGAKPHRDEKASISWYDLREHVASTVGAGIRLNLQNDINEHKMLEVYQGALMDEWSRFIQACNSLQRIDGIPTALSTQSHFGAVMIVHRGGLGILRELDTSQLLSGPPSMITTKDFALLGDGMLKKNYTEFHTKSSRRDLIALSEFIGLIKKVVDVGVLAQIYSELVKSTSHKKEITQHLIDLAQEHLATIVGNNSLRERVGNLATALSQGEVWTRLMNVVSREVTGLDDHEVETIDDNGTRLGWLAETLIAQSLQQAIAARTEVLFEMVLVMMVVAASSVSKRSRIPPMMMADALKLFQMYALLQSLTTIMVRTPEADAIVAQHDTKKQRTDDATILAGRFADLRVQEDSSFAFILNDMEPLCLQVIRKYLPISLNLDEGDLATKLRASVILLLQQLAQPSMIMKLGSILSVNVEVVDTMTKYLPLTPGLEYLAGLGALQIGDYAKATVRFEKAALVSETDDLKDLLPSEVRSGGLVGYYKHIAALLAVSPENAIGFIQAALDNTPDKNSVSAIALLNDQFLLNLSVLRFEEAFRAMQRNPDKQTRLNCLGHLVNVFCEQRQIEALCSGRLGFGTLEEDLESLLWFKAKAQPVWPIGKDAPYYNILYSYYTYRGNHRGAASAMFQYSRRLAELSNHNEFIGAEALRVIEERVRASLVALQSLKLVSPEFGWLAIPQASDSTVVGSRLAKRKRFTTFSSNPARDDGKRYTQTVESVSIEDLTKEYELVMARLVLSDKYPNLITHHEALSAEATVALCCEAGLYDLAFTIAKLFQLNFFEIFASLAVRVVKLASSTTSSPGITEYEAESYAENMTPSEKLLKVVAKYLELHDTVTSGFQYRILFINRVLNENRHFHLPYWMTQFYETHNSEDLIRIYLKHGLLTEAAKLATKTIEREIKKGCVQDVRAQGRWLPYDLLDQLEECMKKVQPHTPDEIEAMNKMRNILEAYIEKVIKESNNVKLHTGDFMSVDDIVINIRREAGR